MLSSFIVAGLALPTVTHNNLFGNNNQIVVNGGAVVPAASPPAASPSPAQLSTAVCGISDETITMGRFPPNDLPTWAWPFQYGTAGYPGAATLSTEFLDPNIVAQSQNLPPYGISCLGFRGFVKALAEDIKFGDPNPTLTDNSLFGLPHPRDVDTDAGQTYMDLYIPWKLATAALPNTTAAEHHIKYVRENYAKLIDGFMFILAFEQWAAHSDMGTKYAADVVFVSVPNILPVDAAMGVAGYDAVVAADLFPLLPKFSEILLATAAEYARDPTGMSGFWAQDPALSHGAGNYVGKYANVEAHAYSAATSPRNTGYTPEALAAFSAVLQADYTDSLPGTSGVQYQVAPSYTLSTAIGFSPGYPTGYHICKDARMFYDYMATISTPTGKTFACAQGAGPIEAFSKLFTYEIAVAASDDASVCNMPLQEMGDLAFSAINAIQVSQQKAYGIYGNPVLSPEQARVALAWTMRILYKHIGYVNDATSCQAANKVYYGRGAKMVDYYRIISAHGNDDLSSDASTLFLSADLGVPSRASVAEMEAVYLDLTKPGVCEKIRTYDATTAPNGADAFVCPYDPPIRLPAPVCNDAGNVMLATAAASFVANAASNNVLDMIATVSYLAMSCSVWLTIATPFDDAYLGTYGGEGAGCGFQTWGYGLTQPITNFDSTLADLCGTSCGNDQCPAKSAEVLLAEQGAFVAAVTGLKGYIDGGVMTAADATCTAFTASLYPETTFANNTVVSGVTKTSAELQSTVINAFCRLGTSDAAGNLLQTLFAPTGLPALTDPTDMLGLNATVTAMQTAVFGVMLPDTTTKVHEVCPGTCTPHGPY